MNRKEKSQIVKMWYLITQIGFTMLTTIFLCIAVGYGVERLFHMDCMIWCILLGVLARCRSVYLVIRQFLDVEKKDDGSSKDS